MRHLCVAFYDGGAVCFEREVFIAADESSGRNVLLASLFEIARRSVHWLTSAASSLEMPLVFGKLKSDDAPTELLLPLLDSQCSVPLVSPFEGCDSIAGGLLLGRELAGANGDDALAKLRFDPQTVELPIHVHEHSDRFIVVVEGEGRYYYAPGDLKSFDASGVVSVPVRRGDVILFLRNVLHTFGASLKGLTLLSYHAPVIAFDDRRQYTLPALLWYPDDTELECPPAPPLGCSVSIQASA